MKELLFTAFVIMSLIKQAKADTVFLVNGKKADASSASISAMDSKNEVLKCDQVEFRMNSKGKGDLKKKDTTGDWKTVKK